jgi:FixJ family two-component response regulator
MGEAMTDLMNEKQTELVQSLICVVDDDPSICKALTRLVRSLGFSVSSFSSGEAFLEASPGVAADCLVLDVHLSGMSGFELQSHLTALKISVPVIFITAHDDAATRDRALNCGAIAYLHKPFEEMALIEAIQTAIGKAA